MSGRTFFNTRKHKKNNLYTQLPHTESIFHSEGQTNEQKACSSLIQESQIGNQPKTFNKQQQPDQFLRATPKIPSNPNQPINHPPKNPNNRHPITSIYQQIMKNKKYLAQLSTEKQKQFQDFKENLLQRLKNQRDYVIRSIHQPIFMDREVLCMTQYIIVQPHCDLYSLDSAKRKQRRSKYLRVLKQMKNRHSKSKQQKQLKILNKYNIKENSPENQQQKTNRKYVKNFKQFNSKNFKQTCIKRNNSKSLQIDLQKLNLRGQQLNKSSRSNNNMNTNPSFTYNSNPQKNDSIRNIGCKMKKQLSINCRFSSGRIN